MAPSTRKQDKMEAEALDIDFAVEKEDKKIHFILKLQHARKIIKIQAFYGAEYKKSHNYQTFQALALAPDDKSALDKVYIKKRSINRIFMVC